MTSFVFIAISKWTQMLLQNGKLGCDVKTEQCIFSFKLTMQVICIHTLVLKTCKTYD